MCTNDVVVVRARLRLEQLDRIACAATRRVLGRDKFATRINGGDSSRVVTTSFEDLEALNEDGHCGVSADDGDDAAALDTVQRRRLRRAREVLRDEAQTAVHARRH